MAKYCKIILYALMLLIPTACDNSDDIGDLLGIWKLKEMTVAGETIKPENLYLCFQDKLADARIVDYSEHISSDVFGNYTHSADSLHIMFYCDANEQDPTYWMNQYKFYDFSNLHFKIETLNSKEMLLRSNNDLWHFVKN